MSFPVNAGHIFLIQQFEMIEDRKGECYEAVGIKTSGHPLTLLCSFLYFDVSFMIWVMLGALGVYISQDFGLSSFEKGFVVALPILSGSVFRIILGVLTDRIGPKKTAVIGMLITMIPLLWGHSAAVL